MPPRLLRPGIRAAAAALAAAVLVAVTATPAAARTEVVEAVDLGGLETRSAALILSGQEAGDLEVSLLPIPLPGRSPGPVPVALVVDVEGGSLLAGAGDGDQHLVTEVYAYAVDGEGRLRGTLTQAFRLDLGHQRARLAATGVKFLGHLDLEPGDYSLRVLVLHRKSQRLRLLVVPLRVPPRQGTALAPPLFPEPAGRWVLVRESAHDAVLPFPLATGGGAWVPATRPRIAAGEASELYLLGRGLEGGLRAHVLATGPDSPAGDELAELGLGDLRPVAAAPAGLEMLAGSLQAVDLPAGGYRLRVSAGAATASLPLVVPPSAAERTLASELEAPAWIRPESAAAVARPGEGTARAGRRGVERARDTYLEALARFGEGDRAAARLALVELESAAVRTEVASLAPEAEQQLLRNQVFAALELTGRRTGGLVALLWLHEQVFQQYHRHRRYLLASHSRNALAALSQAYLNASGRSPEARRLAAAAFASVGGYFQQMGDKVGAARAYSQALDYDPTQEAALIGLATVHETLAEYGAATDLLERFLEHRPGDPQAHLRLAVNLRRLDKGRRAVKHLRACLEDRSRNDWVTAVAYQELADLHAAQRRHPEALAVLDEALERLPGQQRLHLQLAALLDRMDRPAEARAVIDRLDVQAGRELDSPRLRYSQRPTADLSRTRRLLADEARRLLPPAAVASAAARNPAGGAPAAGPGGRR